MNENLLNWANQAEKDKKQGWGSDYKDRAAKETAGYIKKIHDAFKNGSQDIGRY